MSEESWLFLFAFLAALGGVAAFADLIWKLVSTRAISGPIQISRSRGWLTAVLLLGSLMLSIAGFATIYRNNSALAGPRTVAWGATGDPGSKQITGCAVQVDTSLIASLADKYELLLICGIVDPTIDQLQDTRIAVSQPFTISGQTQSIADVFHNPELLAVVQKPNQTISMWQKIVVVPAGTDVTEIKRVADVPRVGGKLFP